MNTRRLMTLGFAGLLLFFAVTALLAAGNSPDDGVAEPLPLRAPSPVAVQASTAPEAPQGVTVVLSHAAPRPEPVRLAPGREGQVTLAAGAPSVTTGILLSMLVGSTVVLAMVLLVGRRPAAGCPARRSRLAQGV